MGQARGGGGGVLGCLSHFLDNQHRVGSLEGHYCHPDTTGEVEIDSVNSEHTQVKLNLTKHRQGKEQESE